MMHIRLDIHNHTIASGHAYSTLQEMVRAAADNGLEYFGITDHGPAIPGTCDPLYFWNTPLIPREMYGVKLLIGCELSIQDVQGKLDLSEKYYERMDVRIAGIHSLCWTPGTKEENTDGVLSAMNNPWVNIISHPGDGTAELCFEPLVKASRDTRTLLEINSSSMKPYRHKDVSVPNNMEILELCRKYDVPVIIGADAHISFEVANYTYALQLIEKTGFPMELVVNYHPELFFEFTGLSFNKGY